MTNRFDEFWQIYLKWARGVFICKVEELDNSVVYLSDVPGELFNYARLKDGASIEKAVEEVKKYIAGSGQKISLYLDEEELKRDYQEYLICQGFGYYDSDTWMIWDSNKPTNLPKAVVAQVGEDNFDDYLKVVTPCFEEWPGLKEYNDICRQTLTGNRSKLVPDFQSEFYVIYDNGIPASGAGMIFSVSENFAYLHYAGTAKDYRNRGHQTDLINFRVNRAKELGIDRIYSIVEYGGGSWRNFIKNGFNQHQRAEFFTLNTK